MGTTGLSCKAVFEVDGSKQSSHSNAYVAGMCGSKRIVIYDTLIKDVMEEMGSASTVKDDGTADKDSPQLIAARERGLRGIEAIVGHEIGHSILHHTWALLGITQLNFLLMFWTFGFVQSNPRLVTDFGFPAPCSFLIIQCFMQGAHLCSKDRP